MRKDNWRLECDRLSYRHRLDLTAYRVAAARNRSALDPTEVFKREHRVIARNILPTRPEILKALELIISEVEQQLILNPTHRLISYLPNEFLFTSRPMKPMM